MKYTDIAIVGGAWAVRSQPSFPGRAPASRPSLVDPQEANPADFRVEKLGGQTQLARFRTAGLADSVFRKATLGDENWIARFESGLYGLAQRWAASAPRARGLKRRLGRTDAPAGAHASSSSSSSSSLSSSA
jgi:hypothetical protein